MRPASRVAAAAAALGLASALLPPTFAHAAKVAIPAAPEKLPGPDGAEGAHIIALGDSIRALKRANLEREAHLLDLESLFATWPRTISA